MGDLVVTWPADKQSSEGAVEKYREAKSVTLRALRRYFCLVLRAGTTLCPVRGERDEVGGNKGKDVGEQGSILILFLEIKNL